MKIFTGILIIIALLCIRQESLFAQVTVEEEVTTDTVDIFSAPTLQQGEREKSPRFAMAANILLPGLGHQYLGDNTRAFTYLTTEALLVFGMVFSERYSMRTNEYSRSYAWKYATTRNSSSPDNDYWKIIGNKLFLGSEQYNYIMELNSEWDQKKVESSDQWYWEDEVYQQRYRDIRKVATRFHVASYLFLGAMILNRAVSFIDVRIAAKYRTIEGRHVAIDVAPYYSIPEKTIGMIVTNSF